MTLTSKRVAGPSAAVLMAIALLAGFSSRGANAQQAAPAASQIQIDNFNFVPGTLTVPAGTTVTWTNRDDIPHTIVSNDGLFKSKARDTDETFSYTFANAGTYAYYCSLHPKMTGKIVVR